MRRPAGFTMAEVMVAIFFLSIALFGYMGLHIRIMHSGWRLEARQALREDAGVRLGERINTTRQHLRQGGAVEGTEPVEGGPPGLWRLEVALSFRYRPGEPEQQYLVETYLAELEEVKW